MLSHRSLSIRKLSATLVALSALSMLHAQTATAPTASQDPESIDQIWQKASSKYRLAIFSPPQPTFGERSIRELTAPGEFRFA